MHRGGRSLVVYTDDMGGVWPTSCRVGSDCLGRAVVHMWL